MLDDQGHRKAKGYVLRGRQAEKVSLLNLAHQVGSEEKTFYTVNGIQSRGEERKESDPLVNE